MTTRPSTTGSKRRPLLLVLMGLAWLLCLPSAHLRADTTSEREPSGYIDVHCHLFGRGPNRPGSPKDYRGSVRAALSAMNRLGMGTMIVMPPPFSFRNPRRYDVEDLIPVVRRHPGRFGLLGGGGTLNVMIQRAVHEGSTTTRLRQRFIKRAKQVLERGALGFGELTAEHLCLGPKHNHQSAPPDHPLFLALADAAAEHSVPIDIHMEAVPTSMELPKRLLSPPNPRVLTPNVAAFERLLAYNRRAKIIWAHVGWDNTGYRTAELTARLLERHPNLYMSFKISPRDSVARNRPIERGIGLKRDWLAVIRQFPDRFLIGSDQFYVFPGAPPIGPPSEKPTHRFFFLLPDDLRWRLGSQNPKRVFRLED